MVVAWCGMVWHGGSGIWPLASAQTVETVEVASGGVIESGDGYE